MSNVRLLRVLPRSPLRINNPTSRGLSTRAYEQLRSTRIRTGSAFALLQLPRLSSKYQTALGLSIAAAFGFSAFGSSGLEADAPQEKQVDKIDYPKVKESINKLLDDNDALGPTFVRLAWHASGSYDKKSNTGGSDGATMRYSPEKDYEANAGLDVARDALEAIKKEFPEMTYADIWTFAGAAAIEYMGGPRIAWRPGRRDKLESEGCPPDERLPNADAGTPKKTVQHIRDIFYRMGFNDQEIVALCGAHALGRCHTEASGYTGPWTRAETSFSNEYFRELVENKWTLKRWDGPDQFEDPTGDLMMLPTDMALLWDRDFRKYVELYAGNEEKFFKDFAQAFQKLEELGVEAFGGESRAIQAKPWYKFWT